MHSVYLHDTPNSFMCHLEGKETRFAHGVKARAHEVKINMRNLRACAPQFRPPKFINMEWDGPPLTIPYSHVFAQGVTHEVRADGYYYVPIDVHDEMAAYGAKFRELLDDSYDDTHQHKLRGDEERDEERDPNAPDLAHGASQSRPLHRATSSRELMSLGE